MFIAILKFFAITLLQFLPQEPLGEYWGTAEQESNYYKLVEVPLPKELAIEAGSFEVLPETKQLALATDFLVVDLPGL